MVPTHKLPNTSFGFVWMILQVVSWAPREHILTRPLVPTMLHVMLRTCLTQEEINSLEYVGFLLEEKSDLIPNQLFSKVDMGIGFDVTQPLNSHVHPITRFGEEVHQVVPSIDHNNKWTIASCMVAVVKLPVMDVPLLDYGKIITINI